MHLHIPASAAGRQIGAALGGVMGTYKLVRLAAGSYDVVLNGAIIASLVMSETPGRIRTWTAELLIDLSPEERPAPFTDTEHQFGSLEEARAWLGQPEIMAEEPGEHGQKID